MKRRDVIAGITGAMAWPFGVRAQSVEPMKRVGMLMGLRRDDEEGQARLAAFKGGLQQAGWIEGRHIEITAYWAAGDPELTRKHAAELVRSSPDVILVNTPPGMIALQAETKSIPIVFLQVVEPTESGAVARPARPGGNVTGFTHLYEYGRRESGLRSSKRWRHAPRK
jgi:putative tryptophan/tyrosine transport system substrate-binding protein